MSFLAAFTALWLLQAAIVATALGPVDKFAAIAESRQMQHTEEALGKLVIAGGDCAVDFEMAEHALDAVTLPVETLVPTDHDCAMRTRRNDRSDPARLEIGADRVGVVALVAEHRLRCRLRQIDQDFVVFAVRRLAAGEVEGERSPLGISDAVSLTGEPAPRAAKCLFASPPFAPAADTWPRIVVESML